MMPGFLKNLLIFFPVIAIFSFEHAFAAVSCDKLIEELELQITKKDSFVRAGEEIDFPFQYKISDLDGWEVVDLSVQVANKISGSKIIYELIDLKPRSKGLEKSVISIKTDANMYGHYNLYLNVVAFRNDEKSPRCISSLTNGGDFSFLVRNLNHRRRDISPPEVSEIHYSEILQNKNLMLKIDFVATDASGICSSELEQLGQCRLVPHLLVRELLSDKTFEFFDYSIFRTASDSQDYYLQVQLNSKNLEKGPYQFVVEQMNVFDLHGNYFSKVPAEKQIKPNLTH